MSTGRAVLTQQEARDRATLIRNPEYRPLLVLHGEKANKEFESAVAITFDCARPGESSFIDIDAERLVSARLNGVALDVNAVTNGRLVLPALQAHNTLEIESVHRLSSMGQGLTRVLDEEDGDAPYFHTQFEDFHAHKTFACFDQPDIKGRFTWTVEAPAAWTVGTNTDPVAVADVGGGRQRTTYARTEILPTYLAAVTAGPFTTWTDTYTTTDGRTIPLSLSCRRSQAQYVDKYKATWFSELKQSIRFLEDFYGFAYPFPKYDQILVPGFKAGAMENPGHVTFYEALIFRGNVPERMHSYLRNVIRHENAHVSGFGDVRTMVWWNDLWLNETFATIMAALAARVLDKSQGPVIEENGDKAAAAVLDQMPTTHPIATAVADTDAVHDNFDTITYQKGSAAMAQLIAYIGLDSFKKGVQRYFQSKWDNATLDDFLGALQAEAPAGTDLHQWGKAWLETKGISVLTPMVDIDPHGRIKRAAISQTLGPNADPVLRPHVIDIGLYDLVHVAGKPADVKRLRLRSRVHTTVAGSLTEIPELTGRKQPDLLLVNDTDLTYAKSGLGAASLATAEQYIGTISDVTARAQLWTTTWHLMRDGEFAARRFARMAIANAQTEREPLLVDTILSRAEGAISYADPAVQGTLTTELRDVARREMANPALSAPVRREWFDAYTSTAAFDGKASVPDVALLRGLMDGTSTVPDVDAVNDPDTRWQVICTLAAAGAMDEAAIRAEGARDNSIQGQGRLLQALASQPTAAAKDAAYAQIIADSDLTPQQLRGLLAGFGTGSDKLLAPYTKRFAADVVTLCATRSQEEIGEIIGRRGRASIFPVASDEALSAARQAMGDGAVHASARRTIMEGADATQRVLANRAVDKREGVDRSRGIA